MSRQRSLVEGQSPHSEIVNLDNSGNSHESGFDFGIFETLWRPFHENVHYVLNYGDGREKHEDREEKRTNRIHDSPAWLRVNEFIRKWNKSRKNVSSEKCWSISREKYFSLSSHSHLKINNQRGDEYAGALNKITKNVDVGCSDVDIRFILFSMRIGSFAMTVTVAVATTVTMTMLMEGQSHSIRIDHSFPPHSSPNFFVFNEYLHRIRGKKMVWKITKTFPGTISSLPEILANT